jgi:hypothetical protein
MNNSKTQIIAIHLGDETCPNITVPYSIDDITFQVTKPETLTDMFSAGNTYRKYRRYIPNWDISESLKEGIWN